MELKYYLRGIGIGVILTAIIMGFALGGRKATMSDAQVIQRAKELGMTEGGVLSTGSGEVDNNGASLASSSDQALDEAGKEISKEVNETVTLTSEPIPTLDEEKKKTEDTKNEAKTDKIMASAEASSLTSASDKSKSDTSAGKEKNKEETVSTADATTESEDAGSEASSDVVTSKDNTKETTTKAATENTSETTTKAITETITETKSLNTEPKTVTIPGGLGSEGVALVLYNAGVIDNATSFNKYLVEQGKDRYIRSGTKTIPANVTYADIASIITK